MSKPLREKITKSGFSNGVAQIKGVKSWPQEQSADGADKASELKVGDVLKADQVLAVGDVVKVQGISKGRGFAGVVKRYGFAGGKRTHGQSDRQRAPGSIGSGTDPGRIWKGKRMPGHYGVERKTITGLVVLHLDSTTGEIWLNGPVPGFNSSILRITKTGVKKQIKLDWAASGIPMVETQEEKPSAEPAAKNKTKVKETKKVTPAAKKEIKVNKNQEASDNQ